VKRNTLEDVITHEQDARNDLVLKASAYRVYWRDDIKRWQGSDVVLYKMNNSGEFVGEPTVFKEMDMNITETPTDFINNQWQPEYMSFMQLKRYINIFATSNERTYRRLLVDLNYKIAFPFACIVTILISAPFALSTGRGAALTGMAKGIVVALFYIPLMALGLALGKGGILPPAISAWFSNIILGGLGIYLINKF